MFFDLLRPGDDLEKEADFSIEAAPMTGCITGTASAGLFALLPGEHRIIGHPGLALSAADAFAPSALLFLLPGEPWNGKEPLEAAQGQAPV